jgi:CBS domain-containing protein
MTRVEVATGRGSFVTPSFEHALVGDAMRHGVISCEPDASLRSVARIMSSYHVHAVVVTLESDVWGIVSAVDVLQLAGSDGERLTAGDIAATEFVAVSPDMPLPEAARIMREHEVAHLIVTAPSGAPVGVLSTLDIAGTLAWGEA